MRICHCHAVSDHQIRALVRSGACSVGQVARACGAGSCCGGCAPAIRDILDECGPVRSRQSLRVTSSQTRESNLADATLARAAGAFGTVLPSDLQNEEPVAAE